jgi:two-component sensor histidine kinase
VSLAHRIVFLIALAIIPLLALQMVTAKETRDLRVSQAEDAAVARASVLAMQQAAIFENAFATLNMLSALPAIADPSADRDFCRRTLAAVASEAPAFDSIAVTDAEGAVLCASVPMQDTPVSFADRSWFQDLKAKPTERMIGEHVVSRLNGRRILPLAISRFENGTFAGVVSIGFDVAYLQKLLENANQAPNITAGLADRHGMIIATLPLNEKYLGASLFDVAPLVRDAQQPGTMRMRGASGNEWLVAYYPAAAPPVRGMYMTVSFNLTSLTTPLDRARNLNLLVTTLTLLAALGIAAVGAHYFIARPVHALQRTAERWCRHDFSARMRIGDRSSELAPLAESLNTMAGELAHSLHQKDLLLREINHRVMNSMQIISSLLMMQSRRLGQGAASGPLMSAVERINALGTVHRRLHLSASIDTIELGSFIRDLTTDVGRALGGENVDLQCRIEARPLVSVDDAVALGLILNEILTNAIKHSKSADRVNLVCVKLVSVCDDRVRLTVEDQGGGSVATETVKGASLGMIVIRSLAQQLEAAVEFETTADGVRVHVDWRHRPLPLQSVRAA